MKILQVIHDFLPDHVAGSEVYTFNLARELLRLGHEVVILTTEKHDDRLQYQINERQYQGLRVIEVVYNRIIADIEETYDEPGMSAVARRILQAEAPDLVHVQSVVYFGVGLLRVARELSIPLVMTLHEYHLLCPRAGLLYDVDGNLCEKVDAGRCSRCVIDQPLQRARYADAAPSRIELDYQDLGERRFHARAVERRITRTKHAFDDVDLFLSPARFLIDMFAIAGLDVRRIRHVAHGFAGSRCEPRGYAPAGIVRFGYVGTLSEPKGVHLLVDALCRTTGKASLTVFGELSWFPDYVAQLRRRADGDGRVVFAGRIRPDQVTDVLREIDVLVVPSLWYEASPLTIREAYLARVPVIATDIGGMREHVRHGEGGLLFPWKRVDELTACMQSLIDEPARLAILAAELPVPRPIADNAREVLGIYDELMARKQSPARRGEARRGSTS